VSEGTGQVKAGEGAVCSSGAANGLGIPAWLACAGFHMLTHVAVDCRVIARHLQRHRRQGHGRDKQRLFDRKQGRAPRPAPPCSLPGKPWVEGLLLSLEATGKDERVSRTVGSTTHRNGRHVTNKPHLPHGARLRNDGTARGATLTGTTSLHVRPAFAPAIVYVMLSRATRLITCTYWQLNPTILRPDLRFRRPAA
jgi:hypothetical protein